MTITFSYESANGVTRTHELPAVFEVCPTCEGHGTHLTPSIRDHAYSADEFAESFDDEEREEYFRHGGRYDVTCEECKGEKVAKVVDRDRMERTLRGRRLLALYDADCNRRASYRAEEAYERRMGY